MDVVWELGQIEVKETEEYGRELTVAQRRELEQVLSRHKGVFAETMGLPPDRGWCITSHLRRGQTRSTLDLIVIHML